MVCMLSFAPKWWDRAKKNSKDPNGYNFEKCDTQNRKRKNAMSEYFDNRS